jgi:hypothetical protein
MSLVNDLDPADLHPFDGDTYMSEMFIQHFLERFCEMALCRATEREDRQS